MEETYTKIHNTQKIIKHKKDLCKTITNLEAKIIRSAGKNLLFRTLTISPT